MSIVAFEGINRCGKTTQMAMAAEALKARGARIAELKFPTRESTIGTLLYDHFEGQVVFDPLTLQYLLEANKAEWQAKLQQWQQEADVVLVDRYLLSGTVYGASRGLDMITTMALQFPLLRPDLTLIYDISVEEALHRSQAVLEQDEQDLQLMQSARRMYLSWALINRKRARIINAERVPHVIHEETMRFLWHLMNQSNHGGNLHGAEECSGQPVQADLHQG